MIYSFVANARKSVDHKPEEYRLKTYERKKKESKFYFPEAYVKQ